MQYSVHYARVPRLFADLELAHGDGSLGKLFKTLTKVELLILDDWGPDRLSANQRRDLMEIVEERYGRGSTLITSQLRRADVRRRHPRPPRAQRLPPGARRTVHAQPRDGGACRAVGRAANEEGRRRPQRRARSQVGEGSQEMNATLDGGQQH
jgi:IstB-like ATP binding protein